MCWATGELPGGPPRASGPSTRQAQGRGGNLVFVAEQERAGGGKNSAAYGRPRLPKPPLPLPPWLKRGGQFGILASITVTPAGLGAGAGRVIWIAPGAGTCGDVWLGADQLEECVRKRTTLGVPISCLRNLAEAVAFFRLLRRVPSRVNAGNILQCMAVARLLALIGESLCERPNSTQSTSTGGPIIRQFRVPSSQWRHAPPPAQGTRKAVPHANLT